MIFNLKYPVFLLFNSKQFFVRKIFRDGCKNKKKERKEKDFTQFSGKYRIRPDFFLWHMPLFIMATQQVQYRRYYCVNSGRLAQATQMRNLCLRTLDHQAKCDYR